MNACLAMAAFTGAKMTLSPNRRPDLDWLRALGALLLIPFHAALIFVSQPVTIMHIEGVINSPTLMITAGFIHMWHMPMLFMISGAATYYALGFRSVGQYIRERFLRLFVPLIFGILTFVPLTIYIQHSDALTLQEGYLGFFSINPEEQGAMNGTFTPAHLWFILYLFVYSLVGLPIFLWFRSEKGKGAIIGLRTLTRTPLGLIVLGVPLTLAAMTRILGEMNPLYYFIIFFYGFVISNDARFHEVNDRMTWVALALGVFAATLNVVAPIQSYVEGMTGRIILGLIYQLGRWILTLAVLGLGHRYLYRTNNALRYTSEAALPFYLLHMTFTVATGNFVIQIDAPVAVKYTLIVLTAIVLTLFAYELVRRWNVSR